MTGSQNEHPEVASGAGSKRDNVQVLHIGVKNLDAGEGAAAAGLDNGAGCEVTGSAEGVTITATVEDDSSRGIGSSCPHSLQWFGQESVYDSSESEEDNVVLTEESGITKSFTAYPLACAMGAGLEKRRLQAAAAEP
jgi:hypothetical protein